MNVEQGKYRVGRCPFHKGAAQTLVVNPDGTYYCLACGKSGKIGELSIETAKVSSWENDECEKLYTLTQEAEMIFRNTLYSKYGQAGNTYVRNRGLSDETLREFGIGYAANPEYIRSTLIKNGYTDDDLIAAGLYSRNEEDGSVWFRFKNRVMFPIRDAAGRTVGFSGRVTDTSEPKYKNTPETLIFRKRELLYGFDNVLKSGKNYLILCEGQMDVIAMQAAGIRNAAASLGTSLTEEHVSRISEFTDNVILLYDTDAAGKKATERAIGMLKGKVNVYVTNTDPCKDPDEFVRKYGAERLLQRIRHATPEAEWRILEAKNKDGEYDYSTVCDILLEEFSADKISSILQKMSKKK